MITITASNWVPDFAKGLVRDLRIRWALEEAGLEYQVKLVTQEERLTRSYRLQQPFLRRRPIGTMTWCYSNQARLCCTSAARARRYFRPIKPVKPARLPGCSPR